MTYQSSFTGPEIDSSVEQFIDKIQVSKDRPSVEVDGDVENVVALSSSLSLQANTTLAFNFMADLHIVDATSPYEATLPTRFYLKLTDVFGHQEGGSGVQPTFQSVATSTGGSELGISTVAVLSPTAFGYGYELPIDAPSGESEAYLRYSGMIYTGASPTIQIAAAGVINGDKYRYRITNYCLQIEPVKTVI